MNRHVTLPPAKTLAASLAVAAALAACTVGPDYKGPPRVAPAAEQAQAFHRAALAQADSAPAAARWWETLNDPELNHLIAAALADSPDVHAAEARLRQSRGVVRQQRANELPTVAGSALYVHTQLPSTSLFGSSSSQAASSQASAQSESLSGDLNLYDVGFDATWEVDVFGGARRAIEEAKAKAQAQQASLEDLHVSLAAEVAQAYVQLRDQQRRLELSRQSAELEGRELALTQDRRARGVSSEADIERARSQLETTQGSLIPLRGQIEVSLDQLAMLTGREPGALDQELAAAQPIPKLPAVVAVGDPSALMRRRPDIRQAERALAASNAQIGEQVANLFPKLNLLGDIGWGSTDIGGLFSGSNFTPVVAPVLQWNILDFGRTRAKIAQAQAGRDEAAAKYQGAVLSALEDAETALSRFGHQRENVLNLERVKASADRSADLTHQRYQAGTASLIDLLDTERTRLTAEQNLAAGQAQLVADYVSLQKSLGLGWAPAQGAA